MRIEVELQSGVFEKIGQGTEASVGYLKANPKMFADIVGGIKKKAAEAQVV